MPAKRVSLFDYEQSIGIFGIGSFQVLSGEVSLQGLHLELNKKYYIYAIDTILPIERLSKKSIEIEFQIFEQHQENNLNNEQDYLNNLFLFQFKNKIILNKIKEFELLKYLYLFKLPTQQQDFKKFEESLQNKFNLKIEKNISKELPISKTITTYMVIGNSKSSKTTTSIYLLNKLLNNYNNVAFLDLNINSPIYGINGILSLSLFKKSNLNTFGPISYSGNFNKKLENILQWYFYGHSSTDNQIETYFNLCIQLYNIYKNNLLNNSKNSKNIIPLIINTSSYFIPSGYHFILDFIKLIYPLNLILINNSKNGITLPIDYQQLFGAEYYSLFGNSFNNLDNKEEINKENFTKLIKKYEIKNIFEYNVEEFIQLNSMKKSLNYLFYFLNSYQLNKNLLSTFKEDDIYLIFTKLPFIKIKFNKLLITLLNILDKNSYKNVLNFINGTFMGIHLLTNNKDINNLKNKSLQKEFPFITMDIKENQFIGIGLIKKVCPFEKVIYLTLTNDVYEKIQNQKEKENNEFIYLIGGSLLFDFNPTCESIAKNVKNLKEIPNFTNQSILFDSYSLYDN
ncbi:hypothetical protein ABK040_004212 [Willaertia magna]